MPLFSKLRSPKSSSVLPNAASQSGEVASAKSPVSKTKYRHVPAHAATDAMSGSWAMEDRYQAFIEEQSAVSEANPHNIPLHQSPEEATIGTTVSTPLHRLDSTSYNSDCEAEKTTEAGPYMASRNSGISRGRKPHCDVASFSSNDESTIYSYYESTSSFQTPPSSSMSTISYKERQYIQPRDLASEALYKRGVDNSNTSVNRAQRVLGPGIPLPSPARAGNAS